MIRDQRSRIVVERGMLTLSLPPALVVANRAEVIDALAEALATVGVDRVRIDAAELVSLDSAGTAALVRVALLARSKTGQRPVLAGCAADFKHSLTQTAVLPLYSVEDVPGLV
jgi:anti-anti-sigma regulatory factor